MERPQSRRVGQAEPYPGQRQGSADRHPRDSAARRARATVLLRPRRHPGTDEVAAGVDNSPAKSDVEYRQSCDQQAPRPATELGRSARRTQRRPRTRSGRRPRRPPIGTQEPRRRLDHRDSRVPGRTSRRVPRSPRRAAPARGVPSPGLHRLRHTMATSQRRTATPRLQLPRHLAARRRTRPVHGCRHHCRDRSAPRTRLARHRAERRVPHPRSPTHRRLGAGARAPTRRR